jgi:c-di-GMP-related signal transduction protein
MSHAPVAPQAAAQAFVARQPILDRQRRVFAYELLFRRSGSVDETADPDVAAARVITDSMLTIGLDALAGDFKAFISVSKRLLLEGIPAILPPDRVVLELGADIEATDDVVSACRALRRAGYSLAIDDFVMTEWTAALVPLADYLKVDFAFASRAGARARIVPACEGRAAALIAKKVETRKAFDAAMHEDYALFQGFFFGQPEAAIGRHVSAEQVASINLLQALQDPNLAIDKLEQLIKQDPALCYRVLRTVNSAAFALRATVHSIREALVLLGCDAIRRWASVWTLLGLSEHAHPELITMAMTRARCCELLGGRMGGPDKAAEGFLLGMCSLLDAILGQPMDEILKGLPIDAVARAALLGEENHARRLLNCAVALERGYWVELDRLARVFKVDRMELAAVHAEALKWTRDLGRCINANSAGS